MSQHLFCVSGLLRAITLLAVVIVGGLSSSAQAAEPLTITPIPDQSIVEDGATGTLPFTVGGGTGTPDTFTFTITSSDTVVIPVSRVVLGGTGANRTVKVTPAANRWGSPLVRVTVSDGIQTNSSLFRVTVRAANDRPSFTMGTAPTVIEDSGAQTLSPWATSISRGTYETTQILSFQVTVANSALFTVPPAISPTGTLTFTPAPNAFGSTVMTVVLRDDGGTTDGGIDASLSQQVTLAITGVADAPTLTTVAALTGARVDTPFVITRAKLKAAANEKDADGGLVNFRVEAISAGSLVSRALGSTAPPTVVAPGFILDDTKELIWTSRNGASGTINAFTVKVTDGAMLSTTAAVPVPVVVAQAANTRISRYDAAGNRLEHQINGVSTTYTYDALNRLKSALPAGGVATTYEYDLNGNLIKQTKGTAVQAQLTWDVANRLTTVVSNGVTETHAYDYRTRRMLRKKTASGTTVTTRFRYDGGDSYAERDATDATRNATFVRSGGMGGGIGSIVYKTAPSSSETFHYNPAVGHVIATTSATRTMLSSVRYDASGKTISRAGTSTNNRLANTKERDSIGFVEFDNHGFRYYDPSVGRYISRDPLGYPNGLNNYLYVNNNPINRMDPLGLAFVDWVQGALDVVGLVPVAGEAADGANALISLGRGNYAEAALSVGAMVPGLGWGATAGKTALKVDKAVDAARTAAKAETKVATDAAMGEGKAVKQAGAPPEGSNDAMQRGRESEKRILDAIGEKKNTKVESTSEGDTIPDFENSKQVGEIKDTKRVSDTKQIRAQREVAEQSGREHVVITGDKTKVSKTVEEKSTVIRRDDLGPK